MEVEEQVLNKENWKIEAQAIINDINGHVKEAVISTKLKCSDSHIYINITTLENQLFCVEVSNLGFRIVGSNYDTKNQFEADYFETPYSLLNIISPLFRDSFGNTLVDKLSKLV